MTTNLTVQHLNLDKLIKNETNLKIFDEVFINDIYILKNEEKIGTEEYESIRNKYRDTLLNTNLIIQTYYDNIDTNINYYDNKFEISKNILDIENVMDIDMSHYCHDRMKEYMFYFDFLSEYYRNLAELKEKKHLLEDELYLYEFNIKVRILPKDYKTNTYLNISKIIKDKDYIIIKFKLNNNNNFKNLNLESYKGLNEDIIRELYIENDTDNTLKDNFKYLLNKINIKNELSIEKELDYFHLLTESYKYKFKKLILNYYILLTFNNFIKYQKRTKTESQMFLYSSESLKLEELKKILNHFNIVFENYYITFSKTLNILNSIDINYNKKSESKKIEESIIIKDKLVELNRKLELSDLKLKKKQNDIDYNTKYVSNSKIYFYISVVLLLITFIIYVSIINLNTNKIPKSLSIILFIVVITTYIIISNLEKNTYYLENFETTSIDSITEIISKLEERKKEINDKNITKRKNSETYHKDGYETGYGKLDDDFIEISGDKFQKNYDNIVETDKKYVELKNAEGADLLEQQNKYIEELEKQLNKLNKDYELTSERENSYRKRSIELKKVLDSVNKSLSAQRKRVYEQRKKVSDFINLINEYDNVIIEITALNSKKQEIRDEKKELIRKMKEKNEEYANSIRELNKEYANKNLELGNTETAIGRILNRIERYSLEKERIEALELTEQANTVILHSEAQTAIYEYKDKVFQIAKVDAEIEKLKKDIENQNTYEQKISNEIINNEIELQKDLEQSKLNAEKATYEAKEILQIIEKKIAKINKEKEQKTYEINIIFDIKISPDIINTTEKKEIFRNNIINEISEAIILPLNRFKVYQILKNTDTYSNIFVEIIIYDIKTYDDKQLDIKQVKDEIFNQSNNIKSKLRNGKYLRLLDKISIQENKGGRTKTYFVPKSKLKIESSNENINNIYLNIELILEKINSINRKENIERTYYDEIHPNLKLELKKYKTFSNKADDTKNILDTQANIKLHDYIYNYSLIYLLLNITLLLSITFILHSYLSYYKSLILLIFIIIFIYLIISFLLNITKNVRTQGKNQYWGNRKIHEYNF
tara:strand:+ start:4001 stop:7180 length:3180 start_codon:yes stop_codon:yes gene_type:complete